jgi:hypothetical protein
VGDVKGGEGGAPDEVGRVGLVLESRAKKRDGWLRPYNAAPTRPTSAGRTPQRQDPRSSRSAAPLRTESLSARLRDVTNHE